MKCFKVEVTETRVSTYLVWRDTAEEAESAVFCASGEGIEHIGTDIDRTTIAKVTGEIDENRVAKLATFATEIGLTSADVAKLLNVTDLDNIADCIRNAMATHTGAWVKLKLDDGKAVEF